MLIGCFNYDCMNDFLLPNTSHMQRCCYIYYYTDASTRDRNGFTVYYRPLKFNKLDSTCNRTMRQLGIVNHNFYRVAPGAGSLNKNNFLFSVIHSLHRKWKP